MNFTTTLIAVATMIAYAIPGFVTVKTKLIKPQSIPAFANILMYVCQPCLMLYSLNQANYTWDFFLQLLLFFLLSLVLQAVLMLFFYLIFRKKGKDNVKFRIGAVATTFGNCGFMGIPILQAVLPQHPNAVVLSVAFLMAMNLLGWTVASAMITKDKKYISIKKAIFNPAVLGLLIGLPLFMSCTKLPTQIDKMVSLLGLMSTPLCMIIMGMRLATIKPKSILCSPFQYFVIFIKLIIMPLVALGLVWFLPFQDYFKKALFIMAATPVASIVLNFAEMRGEGQESAANMVLLSTIISVLTIPLLMLII